MVFTRRKRKLARVKRKHRKRSALTKKQKSEVKTLAKNTLMKTAENKKFGFIEENLQLYHNKPYYLANWLSCKEGTADDDDTQAGRLVRIGDEIYLRNINIRLWLSNKADRPNVMYKAYLFWYDAPSTLTDALCFFTQTNKMLDRINNERISIIDSKTIFPGENFSVTPTLREHSYLCTLNGSWKGKKITYDEGGAVPKKRDIGLLVVCYDAFGTLQTDNIASFAYNGFVTFADP